jgi:glycerophosphoryl diester phosphodiesterase
MLSLVVMVCLQAQPGFNPGLRPLPHIKNRFVVVAHRGNHVDAPENSLDAIREAIRVGANYAEIDLRLTKDGTVVIMHDGTVDRMTNGKGKVADFSLAEISALTLKDHHTGADPLHPPTFEQILEIARGKINLYLDIKEVGPADVLPLLKKYRMERNVVAYLYGPDEIEDWRKKAPKIPIIADYDDVKTPEQLEAQFRLHPFEIMDGPATGYTAAIVAKAHELGMKVWPDIQNPGENGKQWEPFIQMGVDGLQTDHPELLVGYLKQTKRR